MVRCCRGPSDVTVRGGMGGIETLAELRRVDPGVAIVLSTGYLDEDVVSRAEPYGCAGVVHKPYLWHELLSCVKAAVSERR